MVLVLAIEQCELGVSSMETGASEVDEVAFCGRQFFVIRVAVDNHVSTGKHILQERTLLF